MNSIYVLLKEGRVIYVGCSSNLRNRIRTHVLDKDFDSFAEVERFKNRSEALKYEKILIKTISMLSSHELLNKQHNDLTFEGQSKLKVIKLKKYLSNY